MSSVQFRGEWDYLKPTLFTLQEQQTDAEVLSLGGGIRVLVDGVGATAVGGRTLFYLHHPNPGTHSLYFAVDGSKVLFDTYSWTLRSKTAGKIHKAEPNKVYLFSKSGLRVLSLKPPIPPEIRYGIPLDISGRMFWDVFCKAAEDMYRRIGSVPIVCSLSGGTDSTLVAAALKEIGAEVLAVCVGCSEETFDPHWARIYAKQLGVDYAFVQVPTDSEGLLSLLHAAISKIEMYDLSNVLMAMCSTLMRRYAKDLGVSYLFHGHFADDLVGNEIFTFGSYAKRCAEAGVSVTSEGWRDVRFEDVVKMNPNDTQIDKVSRADGMGWRTPFYHPKVIEYLLSCSLEVLDLHHKKPLYYSALSHVLKDAAWHHSPKVGYYTGTGIGKAMMSVNYGGSTMRAVYKKLKPLQSIAN